MAYKVKEIFYSLQGEGARIGRAAVFCRFSGCNVWSGREQDKSTCACPFCDTDFNGTDGINGGIFTDLDSLVSCICHIWNNDRFNSFAENHNKNEKPYVVFTGGEPLLQLDEKLVAALQQQNFEVAIETNGSIKPPTNVDWICVSPKPGIKLKALAGNELKLLYPLKQLSPEKLLQQNLNFKHYYLQAIDDENLATNQQACLQYCLSHPQWHYGFQLHKLLNIN